MLLVFACWFACAGLMLVVVFVVWLLIVVNSFVVARSFGLVLLLFVVGDCGVVLVLCCVLRCFAVVGLF